MLYIMQNKKNIKMEKEFVFKAIENKKNCLRCIMFFTAITETSAGVKTQSTWANNGHPTKYLKNVKLYT